MRKKLLSAILAGMLVIQVLTPISVNASPQGKSELETVIQEVNEKNKKINAPTTSLNKYKYNFKSKKPMLTAADVQLMKSYKKESVKKSLTKATAIKEVNWLFRLLRTQYGLYSYYGGDKTFEKAQKSIIKKLESKKSITAKDYEKLLFDNLNFIVDKHFNIGSTSFNTGVALLSNESVSYNMVDGKFYKGNDITNAIKYINGEKPENYLKRAIDQNGNLTYYPYVMMKPGKNDKLDLVYNNGAMEEIKLLKAVYAVKDTVDTIYNYKVEDGIGKAELNTMLFDDGGHYKELKDKFLGDVKDVKKQSAFVLDLRNNPGGDLGLVNEWFKTYTNTELEPNFSTLRIRPGKVWTTFMWGDLKYYDALMSGVGLVIAGDYYYQYPKQQYLPNKDTNIFVLTSRRTGSAAEGFTDALKNLENVTTIGVNTGGVLTNMANYSLALPYSGLYFQFGEVLMNWDKNYFKEEYGLEPDIYLTGEHLEERLEKFFNLYVKE